MEKPVIDDETKETIEKVSQVANNVISAINEKGEEKINEMDEEDEKKYAKVFKAHQKDIFKLFYFVYIFTYIILIAKFISFNIFDIMISIDLSRLALSLNVSIVFIGCAEGIRSFTTSLGESVGESTGVPAYKLKFLFGYLVAFAIITFTAVGFEFITKYFHRNAEYVLPDYSANDFLNGLISNTISYFIARYGNKIAEGIDLSNLSLFRKKM